MIAHIKNWFRSLDANQKGTVVSSGWIVAITILIEVIFQPEIGLMFIWPLQYAITYFGFARGTVTKSKGWYIDKRSGIKWKKRHWVANIGIPSIAVGIAFIGGMYDPPEWLVFTTFLSPLLISRLIVFVKKLPLGALYYHDRPIHAPPTIKSSTNKIGVLTQNIV